MTIVAKKLDSLAEMIERITDKPNQEFLRSIAEELRGIAFDLEQEERKIHE